MSLPCLTIQSCGEITRGSGTNAVQAKINFAEKIEAENGADEANHCRERGAPLRFAADERSG
jgi:hypothetical protein